MRKIVFLVLFFLSSYSFSQDFIWSKIITKGDMSIFIDATRIKKINENIRVWVLTNYGSPREHPTLTFQSIVEYQELNCLEDKTLVLRSTIYSDELANGSDLETVVDDKWNFNTPNARFDLPLKEVCNLVN